MNGYSMQLASYTGGIESNGNKMRDGMALELLDADGHQVAEVFEDDASKLRVFTSSTLNPIAFEVVEWFIEKAAAEFKS